MKKNNILIVEDNKDILELIGYILEDEPYVVRMCGTAKEFDVEFQKYIPNLVVLDIQLPDGNGIDICRTIKDDPQTKNIPVLLMSAHQSAYPSSSRADDFIAKPFDINNFKSAINQFL